MNFKRCEFMKSRKVRSTFQICGLMVIVLLSGCATVGPDLYKTSFTDYNDAIRKTSDGQMLSNLVRMRYLESPIFMQVASVSTSFNLNSNIGATAGLNEGALNNYGVSAGAGFSETPTITFSLPESRVYYGLLMAPLSTNQITQLIDAGFDSRDVIQATVKRINGLQNLTIDNSIVPQKPKSYPDFREALTLLKKLSIDELAEFAPGSGYSLWSSPVGPIDFGPMSQVAMLGAQVLLQKTAGGDIIKNAKDEWEVHTFARRMSLRFPPIALDSPDVQRLKKLLQLEPSRNSFPMLDYEFTTMEKGRAYVGQSPAALDPTASWVEIGVRGRSMMEIMQIASTAVQIPAKDIDAGVVWVDPERVSDPDSFGFVIKSSKDQPSNATLRTKYRDYWFYIEDSDLRSRESFSLLNALFAVTAGTVPGANPVLTLPVR
jgi:hypothetical protein